MRKSDKKLDNQIRRVLTEVCESALKDIDGFQWLTHEVDYRRFPQSLKVVCVFDTRDNLQIFAASPQQAHLSSLVVSALQSVSVQLKKPDNHLFYDSEEACSAQNGGNWARRLSQH